MEVCKRFHVKTKVLTILKLILWLVQINQNIEYDGIQWLWAVLWFYISTFSPFFLQKSLFFYLCCRNGNPLDLSNFLNFDSKKDNFCDFFCVFAKKSLTLRPKGACAHLLAHMRTRKTTLNAT